MFAEAAVVGRLVECYRGFETRAIGHANDLLKRPPELAAQQMSLVEHEMRRAEELSLRELEDRGIINPKVRNLLSEDEPAGPSAPGP